MQAAAPGLVDGLHTLAEGLTYEATVPVIQLYDYLFRYGDPVLLRRFDPKYFESCPEDFLLELADVVTKRKVFRYEVATLKAHIDGLDESSAKPPEETPGHDLYCLAFNRVMEVLAFIAMHRSEGRRIVDQHNAEAGRQVLPQLTTKNAGLPNRGHLRLVVNN
jgi:hypothetical protein